MQFMSTNGGTHPPEKWAAMSTNEILGLVSVTGDSPTATAARLDLEDMRPKFLRLLTEHYGKIQAAEKASPGPLGKIDPPGWPDWSAIPAAATSPQIAAFFASIDAQMRVNHVIMQHSVDVMHIERRTHADKTGA